MSTRFTFTDRARPVLEIGLGGGGLDGPALWDQARWDQAASTWSGTEPSWVELSCDIVNARCQLGRERITDPYLVGLADLVIDNVGRWADPATQVIPDQHGNLLRLRPGRQIRFGVQHATLGTRWLFRGFIDSIDPVDDANQVWPEVRMSCIDALGEYGRAKVASNEIVGADQTVTERVHDILNRSVKLADSKRLIDGDSTVLIAYQPDGQVVDMLRRTADSGGGWVFGDDEGRIVLRNRDWLLYVQGSEPDFYISNMSGGASSDPFTATSGGYTADATVTLTAINGGYSSTNTEFTAISGGYTWPSSSSGPQAACPTSWERSFSRKDIATRVILDRNAVPTAPDEPPAPDPEPRTYDDPGAQNIYGVEPWERRDLWTRDDVDLDQIGQRTLITRSVYFSMPRVRAANIDAAADGESAVDLLSTVEVYRPSRVRGQFRDRSGTVVFDDDFFVVGITHEITADNWIAKVQLDRSEPYAQLDPGPYAWDGANWDRALWN